MPRCKDTKYFVITFSFRIKLLTKLSRTYTVLPHPYGLRLHLPDAVPPTERCRAPPRTKSLRGLFRDTKSNMIEIMKILLVLREILEELTDSVDVPNKRRDWYRHSSIMTTS